MEKRFHNIKKKINNLLVTKEYYVTIPPVKKKSSFEEEYHFKSVDPDGKKRNLLNERKNYLSNNKHLINFLRNSKPGKIIDIGCGLGWSLSCLTLQQGIFSRRFLCQGLHFLHGLHLFFR